tara:strand:- start:285 stop:1169 length:885 start_codon:yes stop_codon:yes gene_type:complete
LLLVFGFKATPVPIELTPVNPPTHLLDERQEISERDAWTLKPGGKYFFTRNMSAVCAFAVGGAYVPGAGFVCVGAHTDSPCPKLKPNTKSTAERFLQVRTQNYGGGLWYTWFDRDLGVAGRVVVKKKDGTVTHELLKINRPVMRIPSLAIHLNREMNNGFAVNFQQHMAPIIADATESALGAGSVPKDEPDPKKLKESSDKDSTRHHPVLLELIADELRCDVGDVADFDLQLCDVQPSTIGGARNEYIFSGRLDNLASCYASLGKFFFILLTRSIRVLTSCFVSSHSGARQIYG